jgi:hypothetical protein
MGSVGKYYRQTDTANPEAVEPWFKFALMLRPPEYCTLK